MAGELVPSKKNGVLKYGNDGGNGPKIGAKYFKPALRRYIQEHPELVDEIAANLIDGAAGRKKVKIATDAGMVEIDIPYRDQLKAAEIARNTLEGTPPQAQVNVNTGPRTQVVVFEEVENYDTPWPDKVQKALETPILTPEEELES